MGLCLSPQTVPSDTHHFHMPIAPLTEGVRGAGQSSIPKTQLQTPAQPQPNPAMAKHAWISTTMWTDTTHGGASYTPKALCAAPGHHQSKSRLATEGTPPTSQLSCSSRRNSMATACGSADGGRSRASVATDGAGLALPPPTCSQDWISLAEGLLPQSPFRWFDTQCVPMDTAVVQACAVSARASRSAGCALVEFGLQQQPG